MATFAAQQALANAKIKAEQLDCIIGACSIMEQAIPGTATLVQKRLHLESSGIAAFDVNSTCLSFFTALDIASCLIAAERFKKILIVSSEIPSLGLNWSDMASATIFGDGAAAVVLTAGEESTASMFASRMETYSIGSEHCQVKAGGTRWHPLSFTHLPEDYGLFEMDGKKAFKLAAEMIEKFLARLFHSSGITLKDIDWVIPHQASKLSMLHMRRKLGIPAHKWIDIFATHGNQVAASLPTALHEAITSNKLQRGDTVLLLGSAAGISLGGMIFTY